MLLFAIEKTNSRWEGCAPCSYAETKQHSPSRTSDLSVSQAITRQISTSSRIPSPERGAEVGLGILFMLYMPSLVAIYGASVFHHIPAPGATSFMSNHLGRVYHCLLPFFP